MIALLGLASAALGQATAPPSGPGPIVRCGAVERREIVVPGGDGSWRGRGVDLCRAAAIAAWGPAARTEFHLYRTRDELAAAPADQIAFLSAAELGLPDLHDQLRAGPVVAVEEQILLVPSTSPVRRREELSGRIVCFIIGTAAEDALDVWASRSAVPVQRLGFQEPDEMRDAYAAGKCAAMALDRVEAIEDYGAASSANRILDDELSRVPVRAAVPVTADAGWTAVVDRLGTSESRADCLRLALTKSTFDVANQGLNVILVPGHGAIELRRSAKEDLLQRWFDDDRHFAIAVTANMTTIPSKLTAKATPISGAAPFATSQPRAAD